jgi:hypothetical protein
MNRNLRNLSVCSVLFLFVSCARPATPRVSDTNGVPTTGAVAGGMVGSEAKTADEIIEQQEEILRRQTKEIERQNREIEDLRRQEYHNQRLREFEGR